MSKIEISFFLNIFIINNFKENKYISDKPVMKPSRLQICYEHIILAVLGTGLVMFAAMSL